MGLRLPKSPKKFNARKLWLKIHLVLGLTAGTLFAFAGLTGSFLIFHRNIDEQLNAELMLTESVGQPRPIAEMVAAAKQAYPDLPKVQAVYLPRVENGTYYVRFVEKKPGGEGISTDVFVDPITGEVLGKRTRDDALTQLIYQLHAKLLYGDAGETILGVMAILAAVSVISGVLLWWPLLMSGWRNAWSIRRGKVIYDLHKSLGGASAIFLLLIATTGAVMIFADQLRPVAHWFSPLSEIPQKVESKVPTAASSPITAEQAAELAAQHMPDSRLMSIDLPAGKTGIYRVSLRQAGEVGELRGVGRVWIDQYSGEVRATRDWNKFTASDTFFRVQLALHSGDAFGIVGRWIMFGVGFVPALLFGSGLWMWLKKKRTKRSREGSAATSQVRDVVAAAAFTQPVATAQADRL